MKMTYTLCGHCLHSVGSHEPHNGKFMYCASCLGLCDIDEFNNKYEPTSLSQLSAIQASREYSDYVPKEEKKIAKLEKDSQEELWRQYEK